MAITYTTDVRVNAVDRGEQLNSSVTALASGGYVVTWDAREEPFATRGVFAQILNDAGQPVGAEFQIAPRADPTVVAESADGGFFVARFDNQLFVQKYTQDGVAVGNESPTGFVGNQTFNQDVTLLESGGYVVTWMQYQDDPLYDNNNTEYYDTDLYAQVFDASFSPIGDAINVQVSVGGYDLAALDAGGFAITYKPSVNDQSPGGDAGVRIYNDNGGLVSASTLDDTLSASAFPLSSGGFVVLWYADGMAQRYSAAGEPVGVAFQIPPYSDDVIVEDLPEGGFVLGYRYGDDVFVARFDSEGVPTDPAAQINRVDAGSQSFDLTVSDDGEVTVSWSSKSLDEVFVNVIKSSETGRLTNAGEQAFGTFGNDLIRASGGDDIIYGYSGDDTLLGGSGADKILGDVGQDRLLGGYGNDQLHGNSGHDLLNGQEANDRLAAGAGNDRLLGGSGFDILNGAAGRDTLTGGADRDLLTGGTEADLFVFSNGDTTETRTGSDVILDFDTAEGDRLSLAPMDARSGTADSNEAFRFIGTNAFSGSQGQLRYDVINGNTWVQGDTDGDKLADFVVRLDGQHTLTATDFVL